MSGGGGHTQNNGEPAKAQMLRVFCERIERLQEERKTLADDIAEVFAESEDSGFDKHALKIVLKIRANADALAEWTVRSATVDGYLAALGMMPDEAPRAPAHARVENITQFRSKSEQKSVLAEVSLVTSSAAHGADESAAPVHPDPLSQGSTAGELHPSLDDAGAKSDGPSSIVGQGGAQPDIRNGQSGHQDGSAAQDRNEPISASGPAATLPKPLNPNCLKAKRGEPCGLAYSMASCSACANAAFKARTGI